MSDDSINKRSSGNKPFREFSRSNVRKSSKTSLTEIRFNNLSRQIRANTRKQSQSLLKQYAEIREDERHISQQSGKFLSLSDDSFKTAKTSNNPKQVIEIDSKTQAVLDRKNYRLLEKLSQGSFGEVYKGEFKIDHRLVAIKILDISKMSMKFKERYVARELKALIECRHLNVVQIYDIIRSNNRLYIFMEYCSNGTLTMFIKKFGACSESLARIWFRQLVDALLYIHTELKMAHRDIKFDNVLLDEKFNVKLTDFGFAKELAWNDNKQQLELTATICGTEPFMCPQLVQRRPYNPMKADVWAMGVLLFGLLNGRFPFNWADPSLMLKEQTNYPKFIRSVSKNTISEEANDLIAKILDPDEQTRITVLEISKHLWLKSISNDDSRTLKTLISKMNPITKS
ncbi:testis-specific serine/threonine-protein kinase 3 [Dermatophagoides farinae]|uniref:Testis-specific serine/threonine-protein kinase 1-like protein 2 n=1 Tax=Dermatophagoides farinae TaxID=6954 RepID=A0A9D4SL68_DERFA|nr:testis-specific serine/threonine-protein kinase 3-like [Dermatophagoides farinae]KAH7645968.1 testis-specific serine/threonine-protein kinase 1-like protein 2 [Dermatophagoides farinae]